VNGSPQTIENNNSSVNGTKDNSISNQSINGLNGNSNFDKTSDNNKSDKSDNIEERGINNTFNFENEFNKSPEIQKLIDEINKMKNENKEREEKAEQRFKDGEKRIENLENENHTLKTEISETKAKLEEVTKTLGFIQLRDKAKNFLKSFNIKLDKKDKEAIDPKKKTKWKIISEKIKEKYKKYENSNKYRAFIEIVEKSSETIDKGNDSAHKIKIDYYENNIDRFVRENNFKLMNSMKICFLLQIKVSENCLLDGYELLDSFYENNMTRAFTRSKPFEQFFDKK
jgi:sulfur relay (sulfurtransferase) DsrC/TusE family protein